MTKLTLFITKFAVAITIAILFTSCRFNSNGFNIGPEVSGSGTITKETRPVDQIFTKIDVSHGIIVIVEQSNEKSIVVETDDNLQSLVSTKIKDGVLIVKAEDSYNATNEGPIVFVKMPVIGGLFASSGSTLKSLNTLISNDLEVKSSSGSTITISVEADAITLKSSSGSSIKASGKALKLDAGASSGSTIDARNLMANDVNAQTSSGSNANVAPILSLEAKASSGSSINYFKIPKTIVKKESSGGSVSGN